jgi:TRAP-type transport system periplasmic protein
VRGIVVKRSKKLRNELSDGNHLGRDKVNKIVKTSILALGVSALWANAVQAETLKWADFMPQGINVYVGSTTWFADEVNKRSGGKHKVNVFYGGTAAGVKEIPSAVENSVVDMGPLVTPYFPDQFLISNAISFFWPQPNSQRELGYLMLKWSEEVPAFSEELAKYNLKMITVRPLPNYSMICAKPVRTMADYKGKRIRAYGVALPAMLEALGAVPVSMADVDSYEAMSNGVLDCSVGDPSQMHGFKHDEVAKHWIRVPMGASWGHIVVMNIDKYNALPADLKKIIDDLKVETLEWFLNNYGKAVDDVVALWKKRGDMEFIDFPADDFTKATIGNAKVQETRQSWMKRAMDAGMPEADVKKVVGDITK